MDRPTLKTFRRHDLLREDGLTLVEVLVSILLVGLIATSFVAFDAIGRTTADQRRTAQATQIAQADQERMRGMSADQLATLSQTPRTVTLDNTQYQVVSTSKYQSASGGTDSCASTAASADYAKVTSTVSWNAVRPLSVTETSLITPRIGGSLVVQAQDQSALALPNVTVTATGADDDTNGVVRTGTTDTTGCVIFGSLPVGTYTVTSSLSGYLDKTGVTPTTNQITTTAGTTTNITVRLAQPGKITATFQGKTVVSGVTTNYTGSAPAISWINGNMGTTAAIFDPSSDNNLSLTTPQTIFPYIIGTTGTNYTGNYNVYGGNCAANQPPAANQSFATVSPGANPASVVVAEPVMKVVATYPNTSTKIVPAHIKLTDSCGDNYYPNVASSVDPNVGSLAQPAQPYNTGYTVCVDYQYRTGSSSSSSNFRKKTGTVSNSSFTSANSVQIDMNTSTGTGFC